MTEKRREFPTAAKVEIIRRATGTNGVVYCEGCGLPCHRWEIDHIIADGFIVDKSRKLTAADGQLLCEDVCHAEKSNKHDKPAIARAKRLEAAHLGAATRTKARPIRSRGFEKRERPHEGRPNCPRREIYPERKGEQWRDGHRKP